MDEASQKLETEAAVGGDAGVKAATVPLALRVYLGLFSVLWSLSVLPVVLHRKWLWSAEPFWHYPRFSDFGWYYERVKLVHRPEFWTTPGAVWTYPAPDIFVYQFFYAFNRGNGGPHKVFFGFLAYLIFTVIALVIAAFLLGRALRRRGIRWGFLVPFVGVSIFCTWPVYFSMERGNIEFFLDAFIALGVWAYVRKRWWIFAVIVGVFGAGKLYPLLLLGLLLPLRRWRELGVGLLSAASITAFATLWLGPVPVSHVQRSMGVMRGLQDWIHDNSLFYDPYVIGLDHSVFAFIKRIERGHPQQLAGWAVGYALVAATGMLLLFFGRAWKLPRPNQLLMVGVAAVLLPPTSIDYTLILLLPVWGWMAVLAARGEATPHDRRRACVTMAMFALVFAPETFASWHGAYFAGQFKMVCLLALLSIAALYPFSEEAMVHSSAV